MKKILSLVVVMLAVSMTVFARSDDRAHFGLRAAVSLNTATRCDDMVSWAPGWSAGGVYYVPFGRMTYFNGGVMFRYDVFRFEGTAPTNYFPPTFDGDLYSWGLCLPFDFGLKFYQTERLKLSVYTGPHVYLNFMFKTKYTWTRDNVVEKIDTEEDNNGLEACWGLGVAADIGRRWHVHVEGAYGLAHFGRMEGIKFKGFTHFYRANVSLGLGYNF